MADSSGSSKGGFGPARAAGWAVTAYLVYRLATTSADPDLWGYLSFGRLFWTGDGFPWRDVFAYTPTKDQWVYHEWLTGVVFYPLYTGLGEWALQAVKLALGLGAAGLVWRTGLLRGAGPGACAAALFLAGGAFSLGYSPVRAGAFTFFFFSLYLFIMIRAGRTGRWGQLAWLAAVQPLWCNLHGGFVAGLGLIGLVAFGRLLARKPIRPFILAGLAAGAATIINPYGFDYWTYLVQALTMPRPEITEWQSVFSLIASGRPLGQNGYFLVVLFIAALFLAWRRSLDWPALVVLTATAYLGLSHIRHQVLFLLAFGALFPPVFDDFGRRLAGDEKAAAWMNRLGKPFMAVAITAALVWIVAAGVKTPWKLTFRTGPEPGAPGIYYPLGAIDYIKKHNLTGKLLPRFEWGEYLIWTLHPSCLVGMDGRYETVYPDLVCREFFDFMYGRDTWSIFLGKYPPYMILISAASRIRKLLRDQGKWREVYHDQGAVLLLPNNETKQ